MERDFNVFFEGSAFAQMERQESTSVMAPDRLKDFWPITDRLQGYQVKRKGGWDTHGICRLELPSWKGTCITKRNIGKKSQLEEYTASARNGHAIQNEWDDLTEKIGYWVDLEWSLIFTFEP